MKTQALGWLAAGVLALGVNGVYQDGGACWAHRVFERGALQTSGVLALATGRVDQFLTEARLLMARDEMASCRVGTAVARMQTRVERSATGVAQVETMSARREVQLARFEANRARMEGQLAARVARLQAVAVSFREASVWRQANSRFLLTRCARSSE